MDDSVEVVEVIDTPVEIVEVIQKPVEVIEVISEGPPGPKGDTGTLPEGGVPGQVLISTGESDQIATWSDFPEGLVLSEVHEVITERNAPEIYDIVGEIAPITITHGRGANPEITCFNPEGLIVYPVIQEVNETTLELHSNGAVNLKIIIR
tara:strand:- start:51 stop:503 length:453 start_codon:yes stop_codon:yes gene_type:complete